MGIDIYNPQGNRENISRKAENGIVFTTDLKQFLIRLDDSGRFITIREIGDSGSILIEPVSMNAITLK